MSMDLTGITNINEYYTNHYFSSIFEENAEDTIFSWRTRAKENEEYRTPWAMLRECGRLFYPIINRFKTNRNSLQTLQNIRSLADSYLKALGYPDSDEFSITAEEKSIPVYLEMNKQNGAPLLWVLLAHGIEEDSNLMNSKVFSTKTIDADTATFEDVFTDIPVEDLISTLLFGLTESPRFLMIITMNQIALIDREKWNSKRFLQFELEDIFARREETTLQAMSVLLHKESICPDDGNILLDTLSDNSQRHASGVSQDLKYALRESIELLGNEVLYDIENHPEHFDDRDFATEPIDAGQLTLECLRYMYRMLFVLFIEARPELGFAPIKEQTYFSGYSLESLRDIADNVRDDVDEVGDGYYLHETLSKLYELIYTGYPQDSALYSKAINLESSHDLFVIPPLKAHIFDPEYTPTLKKAKIRNRVMLHVIDLMSLTRAEKKKGSRRGRISYANLGINQMGAVYEALLSYRGFIASEDLYEVKAAGDTIDDLDVGYFVPERELDQYDEDERVRTQDGKLRVHKKGEFIYRLAGREREKSASYYTPECLTKCLVKYALKELLKDKSADEILKLTVCEPAMGSAAFLNEAINQLAEAYLDKKQKELGETVESLKRNIELQKIKMYIADNNVYGIDLNPVAVELAEVSLWLNTIYAGGYVPWFGAQLVNGNSLIGARRQGYSAADLTATAKNLRWFEKAPERIPFERSAAQKKRFYHFLVGDPGMCSYSDKVIKSLEPDKIKTMVVWNKEFTKPYTEDELNSLHELSKYVDKLWSEQIKARRELEKNTVTRLDVYGHSDERDEISRSIREKDKFLHNTYKSEEKKNAGAYARLKFAMDYWCALWFWPIEKADELPSRSEFLQDMDFILHGVMQTKAEEEGQLSLWDDDTPNDEGVSLKNTEVDIAQLCDMFPRLAIARDIAETNKFMHWELEFADVFADKGGFDLIIGNPPWLLVQWKDADILCEFNPSISIKSLSKHEMSVNRDDMLKRNDVRRDYIADYINTAGSQCFLGAYQNYNVLTGGSINLYKNFLPQSWMFAKNDGTMAFIHQDNIFDDAKAGAFRELVYKKLRAHYHFVNEKRLFAEVDHHTVFSLNVYSNKPSFGFDYIANLFLPDTIEQCYSEEPNTLYGMKNDEGEWNTLGNKQRLLHISEKELSLFAKLFDDCDDPFTARLALIHAQPILDSLQAFSSVKQIPIEMYSTLLWTETSAQDNGLIEKSIHFPESTRDCILLGANVFNMSPLFKSARSNATKNSDYDLVDLSVLPESFLQRCTYRLKASWDEYCNNLPKLPWEETYGEQYRIFSRKMVDPSGERTLISCIVPPGVTHTDGIRGIAIKDERFLCLFAGLMSSIPYDFFVKTLHKENFTADTLNALPKINSIYDNEIVVRTLMLNALTSNYKNLWENVYDASFNNIKWSKSDDRLDNHCFSSLTETWNPTAAITSDYSRRQAMLEIDVLTAMALGMTLEQLIDAYRITFSVMRKYENDTWYDLNGRIAFSAKNMGELTFKRPEWESEVKDAPAGKKFQRTITDDTMPGGPVERTIEYVAPFDKCDREQDYETAWRFFEEKYK